MSFVDGVFGQGRELFGYEDYKPCGRYVPKRDASDEAVIIPGTHSWCLLGHGC